MGNKGFAKQVFANPNPNSRQQKFGKPCVNSKERNNNQEKY